MKFYKFYLVALLLLFMSACGPSEDSRSLYQKTDRYSQSFSSPVALFIRERNGTPFILASAFLIDKPRGLFASAKHFVGNESDGNCKVFFNGQVYNGFLVRVAAVTDLSIIKILGHFDFTGWPDPFSFAQEIREGDKVFVEGIHPHPSRFISNRVIVPIFRQYYAIEGQDREFVFDNLEGQVVKLARTISNQDIKGGSEVLAGVGNRFIALKTKEDHGFSFGGLSGGPTINERAELVGINAVEDSAYLEIKEGKLIKHSWDSLNLVPVSELQKLTPLLADIK